MFIVGVLPNNTRQLNLYVFMMLLSALQIILIYLRENVNSGALWWILHELKFI